MSSTESTPICRCRVLYLGSSVPQQTKDGLQGIQEPLQELYPEQGAIGAKGIDSWLSVWSNGILLENVDENHKKITRFFPIESLHYCAAVRYVLVPEKNALHNSQNARFLPLDSPFARTPNTKHPPLFAAILRRTTGIKVLECHAFICKREVAANALVRCCFHAYADSSYAKQVDTAGSIYGTLASSSGAGTAAAGGERATQNYAHSTATLNGNGNGKSDEWKMPSRSQSGSTMTINTITGPTHASNANSSRDDISIYNGDENHKVWAGSQDHLDGGIYDVCSTMSRPSTRPRQIQHPVAVPPPPPTPSSTSGAKAANEASKKKSGAHKKHHHHHSAKDKGGPFIGYGSSVGMTTTNTSNGLLLHPPKANSIAGGGGGGTMLKHGGARVSGQPPTPIFVMGPAPPPPPPSISAAPPPKFFKHHNTFSHRPRHPKMLYPPPLVPFVPIPGPPPAPSTQKMKIKGGAGGGGGGMVALEEPIYMPSNRALSPVASYQPISFPHEAYLMQHYATMERMGTGVNGKSKSKKNKKKGTALPPALTLAPVPPPPMSVMMAAHSMNGGIDHPIDGPMVGGGSMIGHLAPPPNAMPMDEHSPFSTGIYRKKGHLNERAFSYSIRQEHRSRSYGSLANLKFATPIPNGDLVEDREDIKKEREIMQMVHDLDLSGDELERSEVPRNMYDRSPNSMGVASSSGSQMAPPLLLAGSHINGRGYRR